MAERLNHFAHAEHVDHLASLLNQYCCSTNPEVGNGL